MFLKKLPHQHIIGKENDLNMIGQLELIKKGTLNEVYKKLQKSARVYLKHRYFVAGS